MPTVLDDAALILRSRLFDPSFYGGIAPVAAASPLDAASHYLTQGEAAGLVPSPLFDAPWYAARWNAARPLLDYLACHGRHDPHPLFDTAFYRRQARSIPKGETPLAHYKRVGWRRGLDAHPLFSTRFYIAENDDVARLGYDPLEHFLTNGWKEGRNPCPEFDVRFYLSAYPDIERAGLNPLTHYAANGAQEGRHPSAAFDPSWYRALLGKKQEAFPNPLAHFRLVGKAAGWLPRHRTWHLDAAGTLAEEDADAWAANARAQATAAAPEPGRPVTVLKPGDPLPPLPEDGLVLVLGTGDELLADGEPVVAGAPGLLTTFDAVTAVGPAPDGTGRVLPVLLPGANPLALAAMPALPVFAVTARLCSRHGPPPLAAPARLTWFRALLSDAVAAGGLRHLAVPVARVPTDGHRAPPGTALPEVERIVDRVCTPAPPAFGTPDGTTSVVICTKNAGHLLCQLVLSLLLLPPTQLAEVILVLNRPVNAFARAYHARLRGMGRVKVLDYDKPYNFSDQANLGAQDASGDFVLLLNDDVVPIGPNWLTHLLSPLARPEVAVAGPLLLYPDETVQHAGMFMGFNNVAGHTLRGARLPDAGTPAGLGPQNCSAVTGAVMLVRRTAWTALGGFDTQLATYLQDVDLCLRARRMGWAVAFTPDSVLFHMESISAKPTLADPAMLDRRGREHARFARRWGAAVFRDPFRSPHLSRQDETGRTLTAITQAELREASGAV